MQDAMDRRLVAATEGGLPLVPAPYAELGVRLGIPEVEVIERLQRLLEGGGIRRIGIIPNHYALGLRANGMSVWDVADDATAAIGTAVGALDFVTHCYERPRHLPLWPYNLFAMVHGASRDEVKDKVAQIATRIGSSLRRHDVLFSTRILKKTGFRIAA
ncbi:MAG: Lrp/AsnC family transcriptional regulator [Alphaproteobacteria bacterium]|nr:Lrp/AsnC family transcriptional regulator [Alphaproteobacteria bacterium]